MSLMTNYNPLPISFSHGKGVWLYDDGGRAYLDGLSGIAVCGLGHAHPEITQTIATQAAKLLHTSNTYHIQEQEALALKLTEMTGMSQVFFGNSGAEANEAAIKLTRLFGHQKGIASPKIIVMERAFHGRTMATLTASGSQKVHAGFDPLVEGFIRAPFNDMQAIEVLSQTRDDIVAVMCEPIQGEGGIHLADRQYLQALAKFCEQQDWLLILDEIQTGNGRTGKLFAYEHYGIKPHILTTAKGLGNGIPIGACLMQGRACDLFKPGSHGSTFGGNPLACKTALKVLEIIERDNLCEHAQNMGNVLQQQLQEALGNHARVKAIRGLGLMIGIEFDQPMMASRVLGLEEGVLFSITADTVMRLLPPLIIQPTEVDELVRRLVKTIDRFFA